MTIENTPDIDFPDVHDNNGNDTGNEPPSDESFEPFTSDFIESLPDGALVNVDDAELLHGFNEHMLEKGYTPESVLEAIEWYNDMSAEFQTANLDADHDDREATETKMQEAWGDAYADTVNGLIDAIEDSPIADILFEARLPDGSLLMNSPILMGWLGELFNGEQEPMSEKQEIEALMRDRGSEYWVGPNAKRLQGRYLELVTPETQTRQVNSEANEREIENIQRFMRTNRQQYNKDEAMQARYLKLLEARGR